MKLLREILSESGDISCMRFLSILSLICGMSIAIYGIAKDKDLYAVSMLVSIFVGAAFTGKVAQSHVEKKK